MYTGACIQPAPWPPQSLTTGNTMHVMSQGERGSRVEDWISGSKWHGSSPRALKVALRTRWVLYEPAVLSPKREGEMQRYELQWVWRSSILSRWPPSHPAYGCLWVSSWSLWRAWLETSANQGLANPVPSGYSCFVDKILLECSFLQYCLWFLLHHNDRTAMETLWPISWKYFHCWPLRESF